MPLKVNGKKYKSFGSAVSSLKKKGYNKQSATRIVGKIQSIQEKKPRKKKRKKKII